jgi:hypothetical protein
LARQDLARQDLAVATATKRDCPCLLMRNNIGLFSWRDFAHSSWMSDGCVTSRLLAETITSPG